MKTLATLIAAAGLAAGAAQAQTITYSLSGTLINNGGGDADGLDGATFTYTADFDASGVYIDSFGLPAVVANGGTPTVTISGSSDGANNTSVGMTTGMAFYPTFAGSFSHPDGLQSNFIAGNGSLFEWGGNTSPATGSGNAFIGGAIELDDFAVGATYTANYIINLATGASYEFGNVRIDAVIPAPASLALLGLGGIAAVRRRR